MSLPHPAGPVVTPPTGLLELFSCVEVYNAHPPKLALNLYRNDAVAADARTLSLAQDTVWSPHHREEMSQLDSRVGNFVEGVLRREAGHVFVVSHGVFIEAALRQLAYAYPG